ncbi:ABC transporter ATP-binding protein [Paracoccus thiocyanatus]|uniref:Sugar ABC transporter ATP-binding protein n=1 Tax=Paracoccus thiocyanatus TaxID=34006 RepID=A0A3D8PB37_9RHOB|nr:sn-glycerol-3-phosphate ABC transporter ATP-binding protein UgpC [Paracoccus thiocyanatus]RDW12852.1 sugar ABC transporter ATP-binding protein [Paracoccus thiocyanatus]
MAEVRISKLRKVFGAVEVIPELDLTVPSGSFTVLVGPSGCGKSTLLRMIAGLDQPSSGRMQIDGLDVSGKVPSERGIAMVFQSYALYPHMTVRDNISFSLRLAKADPAQIDARVAEAAEILQLTPLLDRKPKQLSGGQRQRVAIGRAIVRHPKVFLFDEPLSNLDAALRGQMRVELMELHKRLGATMIYVTHDQVEAMTMADRIVVLNKGRIEQVGSPLELYDTPQTPFVAGFIGAPRMNFIDEAVARGLGGDTLGIRPEDLRLSADGPGWPGRVTLVEQLGSDSLAHVATDHGLMIVRCGRDLARAADDSVRVTALPGKLHLFRDGARIAAPDLLAQ